MGGFSSPSDHTTPPNIFNHFSYHFPLSFHMFIIQCLLWFTLTTPNEVWSQGTKLRRAVGLQG